MEPKKILIIEDDPTIHELYKIKFEKEGYKVDIAENGFEGIVKIQNFNPDLILLDIMMPDMDGFESLKVIKSQSSSTAKIIMFSNINRQSDIDKAIELGADDYLLKADTTPKQAVEKIKEHLENNGTTYPNKKEKIFEAMLKSGNGKIEIDGNILKLESLAGEKFEIKISIPNK